MTLAQLYDQLAHSLPTYARKDVQTAVRVLAKALQCADPHHCLPERYQQPLPTLLRLVEEYLLAQGKGAHTLRNTKNYLNRLFRLAEQQQLISLAPVVLTPSYDPTHQPYRPGSPYQTGSSVSQNYAHYLTYPHWPQALQDDFTVFQTWATAPVVPGRPASLRKRLTTLNLYCRVFESYFGYLHHIVHRPPAFHDLFDFDLVNAYVHWHINECHHRITAAICNFLKLVLVLTRQYRPDEQLCTKLLALKKEIAFPPPLYDKTDAWVSLATLDEIGRAIWPRKQPHQLKRDKSVQHLGTRHAVHAGVSLMLQLWTYRPYRQRNMREMRLDDNLHKDSQGQWRITFRGEQLKIGSKRGKTNIFDLPFPSELVAVLEEYLTTWRPILLTKAGRPDTHVFLTQYGAPYAGPTLRASTKQIIYRYTGKHWHPHNIRTVWTTEWIKKTHGDFYTAAIMLNDSLQTVIANYAHLLEEDVAEKADRLIKERNGQGK